MALFRNIFAAPLLVPAFLLLVPSLRAEEPLAAPAPGSAAAALAVQESASGSAQDWEPPPVDVDARQIAQWAEDQQRSDRTYMQAEMTVVSPRLAAPRVVSFQNWDDRPGKRSFIHILEPAKDRGTTFLKVAPNLWMFVPRVERTMRIPPSMMLQSWMGSDFTNDDLVKESSSIDDYVHALLGVDPAPEGHEDRRAYVLQYTPHDDAPVVWGRIVAWVDTQRGTPLHQEFYDEAGVKLRVIRFSKIREVSGRHFSHEWSLVPLDKEGHETRIRIEEVRFDPEIEETVFSKRNLQRVRR